MPTIDHHHDPNEPGHESTLDGGHRQTGMTRRAAVGAGAAGAVALLFAGVRSSAGGQLLHGFGPDAAEAASGVCTMTPAKTVGPYFVDEKLNRSDVRANTSTGAVQAGVPLTLKLQVFDADNDCAPVKGATVDIWHANASGLYSDEAANGTSGQNWLRGYQTTDANGLVTFTTIYPGWYSGRAVHIHFKVRIYDGSTETLEFTSQLFFTDDMNTKVFSSNAPYNQRSATPDTTDAKDGIYGTDGASLLLSPVASGSGYSADFSVGVSQSTSQLNNTSVGGAGGPGAPGARPGSTTGGSTGSATSTGTTTTATGSKAVQVALKAATMVRTAAGTRQLKLKLVNKEVVSVTAKLTRGGKAIARRKVRLAAGTHTVRVTIPSKTKAGAAKLHLTVRDSAGNTKTYARTVHVHGA